MVKIGGKTRSRTCRQATWTRGKRLFQNNCAVCHGFDGTGGAGPSLAGASLHRAPDNAALIELITGGLEDQGMPPSWHLLPNGPKLIAAYVRTLGAVQQTPVPGNSEHGRVVYQKTGCGGCHIVSGEGTGIGPELTGVGLRRTSSLMKKTILHPNDSLPQGFSMVRVQAKGEPETTGVRVNEDSFTIQLKDANGHFRSFDKAKLTTLERQPGKTPMPSYADSLAGPDLDDLVAYLTNLRGAQ
ncbi:MAG: c-type cytochrome [Acidobacteriota bacterium]|nr:c-type cytochrome [Acidobacteriota bacterium]